MDVKTPKRKRSKASQPAADAPPAGEVVHSLLPQGNELEQIENIKAALHSSAVAERQDEETGHPPVKLFSTSLAYSNKHTYAEEFGEFLAELVSQGFLLTNVSKLPGMPTSKVMETWLRDNKDFREKMALAEKARARFLVDKATEIASESTWKTAKSDQIKIDTAKWLAEKLDPDKYQPKKKEDNSQSLTFIINTHVPSPTGDYFVPKTIEIEKRDPAEVLREENERNRKQLQAPPDPVGTPPEDPTV